MKSELQKALEKYQLSLSKVAKETRAAVGGRDKPGIQTHSKISEVTGFNSGALSQWARGHKRSLNWIIKLANKIVAAQKGKKL